MEFCPRTLAGVLQEGPLQEEDAWRVLRGLLAGRTHGSEARRFKRCRARVTAVR
jgi:hypothetical protein